MTDRVSSNPPFRSDIASSSDVAGDFFIPVNFRDDNEDGDGSSDDESTGMADANGRGITNIGEKISGRGSGRDSGSGEGTSTGQQSSGKGKGRDNGSSDSMSSWREKGRKKGAEDMLQAMLARRVESEAKLVESKNDVRREIFEKQQKSEEKKLEVEAARFERRMTLDEKRLAIEQDDRADRAKRFKMEQADKFLDAMERAKALGLSDEDMERLREKYL